MERPGWYFAPTVLTEVDHTMTVMTEESFGPIIGVQKVADDEEAVALMNDTPSGLTPAVYSRSRDRAAGIPHPGIPPPHLRPGPAPRPPSRRRGRISPVSPSPTTR